MKDYVKPDLEYIKFKAEAITNLPGAEGGFSNNDFVENDFE